MRRIVIAFGAAGFLVPIVLLAIERILVLSAPDYFLPTRYYMSYLWPTVYLLGAAYAPAEAHHTLIILLLAELSNAIIYIVVGVLIALFWRAATKRPRLT